MFFVRILGVREGFQKPQKRDHYTMALAIWSQIIREGNNFNFLQI